MESGSNFIIGNRLDAVCRFIHKEIGKLEILYSVLNITNTIHILYCTVYFGFKDFIQFLYSLCATPQTVGAAATISCGAVNN